MPIIGILNEKPLHASLKKWYAIPGDEFEVQLGRFVIDLVRDDVLVEIQTKNFASIKSKLKYLLRDHKVRVIYPIALEKWIIKQPIENGQKPIRRKSPKRGRLEDIFLEMIRIPYLVKNPNFSLHIVLIKEEEVRRYDKNKAWQRRGWVIDERRLVEVVDQKIFAKPEDWLDLLPESICEPFTCSDLVATSGIPKHLAQKMVYCLREMGAIANIGKRKREILYEINAKK